MKLSNTNKVMTLSIALLIMGLLIFTSKAEAGIRAIMYKPLQCGCCDNYADYLENNGFDVDVKSMPSLVQTKRTAGVPKGYEGCHTLYVDGYVVDGLVPVNTIYKLLKERPEITGITLPGMPWGAPGMDSRPKSAPLVSYGFQKGSSDTFVYAKD